MELNFGKKKKFRLNNKNFLVKLENFLNLLESKPNVLIVHAVTNDLPKKLY